MKIAYDGTAYAGWQKQENALGIQDVIEQTVKKLFSEEVHVHGSGRTDAGVHALGQVAAMDLQHPIPAANLKKALNSNLPADIRIMDVWEAEESFHPQYNAKRKTYQYHFINDEVMPPDRRYYASLVQEKLDMEAMKKAIRPLKGEHDFYAFRSAKAVNESTVRTIYDIDLHYEEAKKEYVLTVTGNGFLYNMVRIIAGTMIEVGKGRIPAANTEKALLEHDRDLLGPTAPPQGLTLFSVEYV